MSGDWNEEDTQGASDWYDPEEEAAKERFKAPRIDDDGSYYGAYKTKDVDHLAEDSERRMMERINRDRGAGRIATPALPVEPGSFLESQLKSAALHQNNKIASVFVDPNNMSQDPYPGRVMPQVNVYDVLRKQAEHIPRHDTQSQMIADLSGAGASMSVGTMTRPSAEAREAASEARPPNPIRRGGIAMEPVGPQPTPELSVHEQQRQLADYERRLRHVVAEHEEDHTYRATNELGKRINEDHQGYVNNRENSGTVKQFAAGTTRSAFAERDLTDSIDGFGKQSSANFWDSLSSVKVAAPEEEAEEFEELDLSQDLSGFNVIHALEAITQTGDWVTWEYETIKKEVERAGQSITEKNMNTIMAIKTLLNSNVFFENPRAFEKVCLALNGRHVDYSVVQPLEASVMAACVLMVQHLRDLSQFSAEVAAMIAVHLVDQGYVIAPHILRVTGCEEPMKRLLVRSSGQQILSFSEEVEQAVLNVMMMQEDSDHLLQAMVDLPEQVSIQCWRLLKVNLYAESMIPE